MSSHQLSSSPKNYIVPLKTCSPFDKLSKANIAHFNLFEDLRVSV
eukprot:UN11392